MVARILNIAALALLIGLGFSADANADEAFAKSRMKAMSDYITAQKTISFAYDANLEIVTPDHQKIMLANSGTADLDRTRFGRHGTAASPALRCCSTVRP